MSGPVAVAGFTSRRLRLYARLHLQPVSRSERYRCRRQRSRSCRPASRGIELRKVGNGAAAGPGNFGFLEPPDRCGNGRRPCADIANVDVRLRAIPRSVTRKTGQNAGPVQDAFNIRFGIVANGPTSTARTYGPAAPMFERASITEPTGAANQGTDPATDTVDRSSERWACRGTRPTPYIGRPDGRWKLGFRRLLEHQLQEFAAIHRRRDTTKPHAAMTFTNTRSATIWWNRFDRWRDRNAAALPSACHDSRSAVDLWRHPELRLHSKLRATTCTGRQHQICRSKLRAVSSSPSRCPRVGRCVDHGRIR